MESLSPPIPEGRSRLFKYKMLDGRERSLLRTPAAGSLYSVLDSHATVKLFTRPIQWTDMHTHLLGCRFVRLPLEEPITPPSSGSTSPSSPPPSSPSQILKAPNILAEIREQLRLLMSAERSNASKNKAIINILSRLYPETLSSPMENLSLGLDVGDLRYPSMVTCPVTWGHGNIDEQSFNSGTTIPASRESSPVASMTEGPAINTSPMLAYYSQGQLNYLRRSMYQNYGSPNGGFNCAGHRLGVLCAKKLQAKNPNEDAYFLAMIIAMAQESARKTLFYRDFKARVLSVSQDEKAFLVYTATVPIGFLTKFRAPLAAPTGYSGIKIEYTKVPVYPVLGLRERLGEALGSDVVGDLDNALVNCQGESVPTSGRRAPKRPLPVVSNASFSENREPPPSRTLSRKKRRLV
ncbi:hypothetical protein O1611_g2865 [Lasiodiplodia mahajangana]|uniref:Uncharacterized protein n=1 Tax=Lasiodiplodia mahajangana TaxID=1108764 RepID=A0ACC2JUA0_9PEZI|nr:hypothetical protein O1611_g2865 [Lasiodiplodia mahajangana]